MTVAVGALAAAVAILATVLAAVLVTSRRAARRTEERLAETVSDVSARMELAVRELQAELREAQRDSRRSRTLAELAASLELDDVLERILESAVEAVGADAALARLPDAAAGKPLVVTLGLSADEARREGVVAGPPDGRPARAVAMTYRYAEEDDDGAVLGGLAVPLRSAEGEPGVLAVFTRARARTLGDDDLIELEALASHAGPALQNARRFQEARRAADLDALTGLHNRRFFHDVLARETGRAHRYRRRLALLVLDVDDFKAVNDRIGHLAGDGVLAEVAQRVRSVLRSADVACRIGGDEFAVVLPEADVDDAEQLFTRLQGAVSARPATDGGTLHLSAGVAALRPEDDARSLFQRADDALYRAKHAGKARLASAPG